MADIELFIVLLAGVVGLVWLAGPLRVPYPLLLVAGGLGAGLIPFLPDVRIDPDVVMLVFLPPILYYAAHTFAGEDLRLKWAPIAVLAVGLVLVTLVAVACVAHLLLGVPWAAAFILGAILGPTDPVAAVAVLRRLGGPDRTATILEGESLVNDATGLTAFRLAVAAAGSQAFSPGSAVLEFGGVVAGGAAVGLVLGYAATWVRRRLEAAHLEITVSVLTAYGAFALAERLHVSGILATVVAGFLVGRARGVDSPETRLDAEGFWSAFSFIAESTLFLLVGLAFADVLTDQEDYSLGRLVLDSLVVATTVFAVRLVWMYAAPHVVAHTDRRSDDAPLTSARERLLLGVSGMRGAVSAAAALAIPHELPGRDAVLLLTCGVVLFTLVPGGLLMPLLTQALGLTVDDEEARRAYVDARVSVAQAALDRADQLAHDDGAPHEALARAREAYEQRIARLERSHHGDRAETYRRVREEMLRAEEDALEELSDGHEVRGETLRAIRRELDLEAERLRG